jgi:Calx-beta domain
MSNSSKAGGAGAPGRGSGGIAAVLPALLLAAVVVVLSGGVRAERFVLKSGEIVDGSIIETTRNTVIIARSIGGMRQLPIQEIGEVRFDLARGQQVVGQFLGWADGVYEMRSGDEIVRVSESGILSREPGQQTARILATRPRGQQQSTAAAAPAEQRAEPAAPADSAEQTRSRTAAGARSDGAAAADVAERQERQAEAETTAARESQPGGTEARAAAARETLTAAARQSEASETESQGAAEAEDEAAAERPSQPAADAKTAADAEPETAAAADRQRQAADKEVAALGEQGILAVKASVDPPEPGARAMVFNIELSEPAKQTVVLIYGTVDGTAKAGEDYEAQQGMVTVAPGATAAEVRVPLLEGAPEEGEKRFELVLMADPKVAEVVDRRVIATIKGDE